MRESLGPYKPDENSFTDPIDGAIENISACFPRGMTAEQIGVALLELETNVAGVSQPPIASVRGHFDYVADPELKHPDYEDDYKGFWVEFEFGATEEEIVKVLRIVADSIRKYRQELGY